MALALLQLTTLQALPGGSLNTWERPCLQLTILLHLYFPALKQNPRCNRMYIDEVYGSVHIMQWRFSLIDGILQAPTPHIFT